MRIRRLELRDFRNYAAAVMEPSPGLNLVVGPNGHGKTNLLEAAWMLTGTRSPRAADPTLLIRHGASEASVRALVDVEASGAQRDLQLRLSQTAPRRSLAVNAKALTRAADAVGLLLAVWVSPDAAETVRGEPQRRRQFLDVALAQLDPTFREAALQYARVLAQRNRLLASPAAAGAEGRRLLEVYDEQLAQAAATVVARRVALLEELRPVCDRLHAGIAGEEGLHLELEYRSSTPLSSEGPQAYRQGLLRRLGQLRAAERARRCTLAGPHRDDVAVRLGGLDLRRLGSRGQQRTAGLAMHLGLWECLYRRAGEPPVLLVDDAASELDEQRRRRLWEALPQGAQVWLSATEAQLLATGRAGTGGAVWRVCHGRLELVSG